MALMRNRIFFENVRNKMQGIVAYSSLIKFVIVLVDYVYGYLFINNR